MDDRTIAKINAEVREMLKKQKAAGGGRAARARFLAMNADLEKNPRALLDIAESTIPPEVKQHEQQIYDENEEAMLVQAVQQSGSNPAATASFSHLAKFLAERYGEGAMEKARELLGADQQ